VRKKEKAEDKCAQKRAYPLPIIFSYEMKSKRLWTKHCP